MPVDAEDLVLGDHRAPRRRNARSASGIAASISRRMTTPRRRCFSARLELAHQILGLFLDLDVAVADQPEGALPRHRVAGKQLADEHHRDVLERDEARAPGLGDPAGE